MNQCYDLKILHVGKLINRFYRLQSVIIMLNTKQKLELFFSDAIITVNVVVLLKFCSKALGY